MSRDKSSHAEPSRRPARAESELAAAHAAAHERGVALRQAEENRDRLLAEVRTERIRTEMALEAAGMVTWEWDIPTGAIRHSRNLPSVVRGEAAAPYCSLDSLIQQVHAEDCERLVGNIFQMTRTPAAISPAVPNPYRSTQRATRRVMSSDWAPMLNA